MAGIEVVEPRRQVAVGGEVGVPHRADQHHARQRLAEREVVQDDERGHVHQLEVLDDAEHRPTAGELHEQGADRPVEEEAGELGIGGTRIDRTVRGDARHEPRQLVEHRCQPPGAVLVGDVLERLVHQRGDRLVREQHPLEALRPEHDAPGGAHTGGQLGDESGLADARLAAHDHRCRVAGDRLLPEASQLRELGGAADEHRAGPGAEEPRERRRRHRRTDARRTDQRLCDRGGSTDEPVATTGPTSMTRSG